MKFLDLAFIYNKRDALRYVKFVYIKSQTLGKKQDNLRYGFLYKNMDTLRHAISIESLKLVEGRGIFVYPKNNALCVTFLYRKSLTLCVTFLYAKKCTLRCVLIFKTDRIVLIPNHKHTYCPDERDASLFHHT